MTSERCQSQAEVKWRMKQIVNTKINPRTNNSMQQALIGFSDKPSSVKDKDNTVSDYKPEQN
jgi:hypothetical protein